MMRSLLVLNLGSPNSPEPSDVGKFLREFLMDPYVIDIPWPLRFLLVNILIVPRRSHTSAHAYKSIWREDGSPLIRITEDFAEQVGANLGDTYQVLWASRYGEPSLKKVLPQVKGETVDVIPLYPQFAQSSTQTAIDAVGKQLRAQGWQGRVRILRDFYSAPEFIEAQAKQIQIAADKFAPDHLLMSFHGLPEHHLTRLHPDHCLRSANCCDRVSDANRLCYRAQSFATARAVQAALNWPENKFSVSFQSRLGRRPWIKPYTDVWLNDLKIQGVRRLLVTCPSFVADCLETLEEVAIRLSEQFKASGGEDLMLVPAVNSEPHWIEQFCSMVQRPSLHWENYAPSDL